MEGNELHPIQQAYLDNAATTHKPQAVMPPDTKARLMALSSFNEQIRSLQRLLVGQVEQVLHADDLCLGHSSQQVVPRDVAQADAVDEHPARGHVVETWDERRQRRLT